MDDLKKGDLLVATNGTDWNKRLQGTLLYLVKDVHYYSPDNPHPAYPKTTQSSDYKCKAVLVCTTIKWYRHKVGEEAYIESSYINAGSHKHDLTRFKVVRA